MATHSHNQPADVVKDLQELAYEPWDGDERDHDRVIAQALLHILDRLDQIEKAPRPRAKRAGLRD